jgi:multiple antibiotic resistance protein
MDPITAFVTLALVMDPLGNVPLFLSVLKDVPQERRFKVILRELVIALAVMLLFLFAGEKVLNLLGLQQEAIAIAGAIILFLIAIRMIFPSPHGIMGETPEGEPFIVPLAIPAIAGPSVLAIAMLLVSNDPARMLEWTIALICAWLATSVVLLASPLLLRALGNRGLIASERLMGMVLVIIAVQMFFDGARSLMNV